jgi:type I restriction enzyme S subunit
VLFSSRAPIGYVAIAANAVATNQGFKSFVLRDEVIPDFVYHYLQRARDLARSVASGTTFLEISGKKAAQIPIPVPPLDEQQRIVAEIEKQFTRLDAGVASLKRVQTVLKRYRASVLKAACEGKLVATKTDSWRAMTVQDVSSTIYRYPTFYGLEHLQKGVPVIRGEHIEAGGRISHDWSNYWFISKEVSERFPRTVLETGDLVMSVRGSVGKIGIVDKELSGAQVSPNCIRIALRKDIVGTKWMFIYLTSGVGAASVRDQVNQTTIETIKASAFKKTRIPIPPIADQQRIITEVEQQLSAIEELDAAVRADLQRAPRLRQSILNRAFAGRLVR